MKILNTILSAATFAACVAGAQAQNVDVRLKNGTTVSYPASDVVSVTFTPGGENPSTHECVDLGLSVKWATMNVGADGVADYGDYFAWGEIATKEDYNQGNCTTIKAFTWDAAKNDAAYVAWGADWRMPTGPEMQELIDECTWEWTTMGSTPGYKITSKKDGYTSNYIFLPAAGYRVGGALNSLDEIGYYWTSTESPANTNVSRDLYASKSAHYLYWTNRFQGFPVRPVKNK